MFGLYSLTYTLWLMMAMWSGIQLGQIHLILLLNWDLSSKRLNLTPYQLGPMYRQYFFFFFLFLKLNFYLFCRLRTSLLASSLFLASLSLIVWKYQVMYGLELELPWRYKINYTFYKSFSSVSLKLWEWQTFAFCHYDLF